MVHDASLMAHTHQLSTAQRMADSILRGHGWTLETLLRDLHFKGLGYEAIAKELDKATDGAVSISYQTVKKWLANLDIYESGAVSVRVAFALTIVAALFWGKLAEVLGGFDAGLIVGAACLGLIGFSLTIPPGPAKGSLRGVGRAWGNTLRRGSRTFSSGGLFCLSPPSTIPVGVSSIGVVLVRCPDCGCLALDPRSGTCDGGCSVPSTSPVTA